MTTTHIMIHANRASLAGYHHFARALTTLLRRRMDYGRIDVEAERQKFADSLAEEAHRQRVIVRAELQAMIAKGN